MSYVRFASISPSKTRLPVSSAKNQINSKITFKIISEVTLLQDFEILN